MYCKTTGKKGEKNPRDVKVKKHRQAVWQIAMSQNSEEQRHHFPL